MFIMAQANTAANKSSNNSTMDKDKILRKDNYLRAYTSNVCDMSMPTELGISDQTVPTMNFILSTIRMKNPKLRPKSSAVNPCSNNINNTAASAAAAALNTVRSSKFEAAAIASLNETFQLQLKLSLQQGWIRKLGIEKKVVNFFMNKASKKQQLEMQTEKEAAPSLNKTFNKEKTTKTTTARRRLDTTFSVIKSSNGQTCKGGLNETKTDFNKTYLLASNSSNFNSTAQPFNTKNQTNKLPPLRPSSVSAVSVTASSASMGFNIR